MTTRELHDRRLERGRRWWDLVSGSTERATYTDDMLDLAIPELDVRPGHTVLEIGCGPGNTFERLREAAGPGGRVLGVDYSPKMLARAQRRISEHGWDDVAVRRTDFTRGGIEPGSIDRAIAISSISAMPDVPAAIRHAHDALRPGGRLFVFDMKLTPGGWSTPLIWFFDAIYRLAAGYTGVDVLESARRTFAEVRLPDVPARSGGTPRPQPERGWPPLTCFVATRAGADL